jgi:hypothetical protein
MESSHDDRFIVFLRQHRGSSSQPDLAERPLVACSSYAEARRVMKEFQYTARECVIRYVGPAGGGD